MTPNPGKKRELVYFCDGGCLNNGAPDAQPYGSWKCVTNGRRARMKYTVSEAGTNNKAEYLTLINLLMALVDRLYEMPKAPVDKFVIHMDSQLVVNQVGKKWEVNEESLMPFRADCLRLIKAIEDKGRTVELKWVPREEVFKVLGH